MTNYQNLYSKIASERMKKNLRERYAKSEEQMLNNLRKWIDTTKSGLMSQKLGWIVICKELEQQIIDYINHKLNGDCQIFTEKFCFIRKSIKDKNIDFSQLFNLFEKDKEESMQDLKSRIQLIISWYVCVSEGESYKAKLKREQRQIEEKIEKQFQCRDAKWWVKWIKKQSNTSIDLFQDDCEAQFLEETWRTLRFPQQR